MLSDEEREQEWADIRARVAAISGDINSLKKALADAWLQNNGMHRGFDRLEKELQEARERANEAARLSAAARDENDDLRKAVQNANEKVGIVEEGRLDLIVDFDKCDQERDRLRARVAELERQRDERLILPVKPCRDCDTAPRMRIDGVTIAYCCPQCYAADDIQITAEKDAPALGVETDPGTYEVTADTTAGPAAMDALSTSQRDRQEATCPRCGGLDGTHTVRNCGTVGPPPSSPSSSTEEKGQR